ncbi:MAG: tetratricopeptide repeat protein [Fibrobacter sp.]|nr:tetratricopeptide repeat protein [Fibrobacter sp.]
MGVHPWGKTCGCFFTTLFDMNIRLSVAALTLAFSFGISFAADPRIEQGAIFEAKGDYEMALGEYRALLAEQPQNSEAYFLAAEVYLKMPKQDFARALANYRLAYKFTPTMSKAYEGAAKVYRLMGQKAKAEEELAKDPKNRPVEEVAAPAAESVPAEAPVAAAPAPQKAAEVAPEPVKVSEPAPQKVAEPVEKKIAETPKPVEAPKAEQPSDPFEKGKALLAEGKYKEAAAMWREVLAKQPGHAGAYFYAGVTRYEMGEYDKAEFNLKKGLSYKEQGNDANYYLALVYQKTNRSELEKKALSAYIKKAAPDAKFRALAENRIAEMKAAAEAAKAETEPVAATKPAEEPVKANAQATAPAQKAVAAAPAPANDEYSVANANSLFKSGNLAEALRIYKALLDKEISTDDRYFAMLQMGNIYRELRDFHSAVTRYRTVVQQYPESDWAAEAERALEDAVWLERHASELPRRTR